jgi:hypothetical protein
MKIKTSRGFIVFVRTTCCYETGSVIQSCNGSLLKPIPGAAFSKARVCGRSFAGILVSNSAEGWDIRLFWVLRVVR